MVRSFFFDLMHSLRSLRRSPGYLAASVLTLALGIGVASVLFSFMNQQLVEPLAFRNADRLAILTPRTSRDGWVWQPLSARQFHGLEGQAPAFEGFAALRDSRAVLESEGGKESVKVCLANPGGLSALGLPFVLGRDPRPREEGLVLSFGAWQRRFGGDPGILGRTLVLDHDPVPVLGVLAKGVRLPMMAEGAEFMLPLEFLPGELQNNDLASCWVMGLLKRGDSMDAARIQLQGLSRPLAPSGGEREGWAIEARGLKSFYFAQAAPMLALLGGMAAFMLLLTCANVAGLSLARLDARAREAALRSALGGSRAQLMGGPLAEALLLALAAALVVALASRAAAGALASLDLAGPGQNPRLAAATLVLALLVALVTGLTPALLGSRIDLRAILSHGGGAGSRMGWRKGMVVFQVALATMLLGGAGLLGRALARQAGLDIGIRTQGVLTAQFSRPEGADPRLFFDRTISRLGAIPGVQAVGVADGMPLYDRGDTRRLWIEGQEGGPSQASVERVSKGYFPAMGATLVRGRVFEDWEEGLCVVSESLARNRWPGQDPMGRRLSPWGPTGPWLTVAGVVRDHRHNDVTREATDLLLTSFRADRTAYYAVLLRTGGDPSALAPSLRSAFQELDPGGALDRVEPLQAVADRNLSESRTMAMILGAFGLLAGLLAAIGIYGVMASLVKQQRREMGLRLALGALPRQVLAQVLLQGARHLALGLGIGCLATLFLGRALHGVLLGMSPLDLPSLLGAAAGVTLLALGASLVPALRVVRISPAVPLRYE
jgi:predicted permease